MAKLIARPRIGWNSRAKVWRRDPTWLLRTAASPRRGSMRGLLRVVFVVVVASASAALAVPISGHRAGPEHSSRRASAGSGDSRESIPPASKPTLTTAIQQNVAQEENQNTSLDGRISVQTLEALGLSRVANLRAVSERIAKTRRSRTAGKVSLQSGQPLVLNSRSALS